MSKFLKKFMRIWFIPNLKIPSIFSMYLREFDLLQKYFILLIPS